MRFLSVHDGLHWLQRRTFGGDALRRKLTVSFEQCVPHTSYVVARTLVNLIAPQQETLLWINEWGVWPSSENMHMYLALRRANGNTSRLADSNVHLFAEDESENATDFLQLVIENGWDASLFTSDGSAELRACHDGWLEVLRIDAA